MNKTTPSPLVIVLAMLLVQVLFGLNYVISKQVLTAFPPLVWACLRMAVAAILMAVFSLILRRPIPKDAAFYRSLVVFSFIGCVVTQASFLVGLKYTTSTNSAILNTLIPLLTLAIVTMRGIEPLSWKRLIGFGVAFSGVLIIRKAEEFTLSNTTWVGDLLTILNCASYALFLTYGRPFLQKYDAFWSTTWLFAYGAVGLAVLAAPQFLTFSWPELTPALWGSLAYTIVAATLLTYFLSFWALAYASSSNVAFYVYLQPVIASVVAWLWMDEVPTVRTYLACGLIFVGFLLAIQKSQSQGELRK